MRTFPSDEKRLELLNQSQPSRPWRSCSEKRRCVVCDRVFRGGEVIVRWACRGAGRLACPGCESAPALWVRPGNPLTNEQAWAEWESAMDLVASAAGHGSGRDFAAAG